MNAMKSLSQDAYDWLMKTPVSMWSRHAFDHRGKSEHITNNMTESFNQWITMVRNKPILTIVDQIRVKLMCRLQRRYEKGCSYNGKVPPNVKKRLDRIQHDARFCRPISSGNDKFEVTEATSTRYAVNLHDMTCTCKLWEVTGLPCRHAAAAILFKRGNLEDYCDSYFTVQRYLMAHWAMINPMPDLSMAPTAVNSVGLRPPPLRRLPGRPHKNRRREEGEKGVGDFRKRSASVRCEICKHIGHNRRTCQKAPVRDHRESSQSTIGVKVNLSFHLSFGNI